MRWFFERDKNLIAGLRLILVPNEDTISTFIHSVKLAKVPVLLQNVACSKGYSQEFISLLFYHEMDWEDKEDVDIQEGEVCLYVYQIGETVLKESIFDQILCDYCAKLSEVYQDISDLAPSWQKEVQQGLQQLRMKIAK